MEYISSNQGLFKFTVILMRGNNRQRLTGELDFIIGWILMTTLKTFISVFALSSVQRDAALLGAISNQHPLFHISKEATR